MPAKMILLKIAGARARKKKKNVGSNSIPPEISTLFAYFYFSLRQFLEKKSIWLTVPIIEQTLRTKTRGMNRT